MNCNDCGTTTYILVILCVGLAAGFLDYRARFKSLTKHLTKPQPGLQGFNVNPEPPQSRPPIPPAPPGGYLCPGRRGDDIRGCWRIRCQLGTTCHRGDKKTQENQ